jgi:hypothetical protein
MAIYYARCWVKMKKNSIFAQNKTYEQIRNRLHYEENH